MSPEPAPPTTEPLVPVNGPVDPNRPPGHPSEPRPRRSVIARHRHTRRRRNDVLVAIATGGSLGSAARYELALRYPSALDRFPTTTLVVNLTGCLALGATLYVAFERRPTNRLLRPFLAIGLIGGFTTFSTFTVEIAERLRHHPTIAVTYLAASIIGGVIAVLAGTAALRALYRTTGTTKRKDPDGTQHQRTSHPPHDLHR